MSAVRPIALLSLCLAALSGCGGVPQDEKAIVMTFTAADTGTTKQFKVGQTFDVKLLGTPTAGYVWEVQNLPRSLILVETVSQPENTKGRAQGMVGGNDWTRFRFKTKAAPVDLQAPSGQALVLRYGRPWELAAGQPAGQVWRMQIDVKSGS